MDSVVDITAERVTACVTQGKKHREVQLQTKNKAHTHTQSPVLVALVLESSLGSGTQGGHLEQ